MSQIKKLTNRVKRQIKLSTKLKLITIIYYWLIQLDHLFVITVIYCLSVLCGALLPKYLVDIPPGWSKTTGFNSGITTHAMVIGIGVYLIINWLENHKIDQKNTTSFEKQAFIMLAKTLIIAIPIIVINISNNINTKPIVNNQYEAGIKNKQEETPDRNTITSKDGHTYQINNDNYIESHTGNQDQAVVKLIYDQPVEVIYPKER